MYNIYTNRSENESYIQQKWRMTDCYFKLGFTERFKSKTQKRNVSIVKQMESEK